MRERMERVGDRVADMAVNVFATFAITVMWGAIAGFGVGLLAAGIAWLAGTDDYTLVNHITGEAATLGFGISVGYVCRGPVWRREPDERWTEER